MPSFGLYLRDYIVCLAYDNCALCPWSELCNPGPNGGDKKGSTPIVRAFPIFDLLYVLITHTLSQEQREDISVDNLSGPRPACVYYPDFPGCDTQPPPQKQPEKRGSVFPLEAAWGSSAYSQGNYACTIETCDLCPDWSGCLKKREEEESESEMRQEEKRADTWWEAHGPPVECDIESCDSCPEYPGCND